MLYTSPYRSVLEIFFFQAEDGIRDIGVTGVQTCALPISGWPSTRAAGCRCSTRRRGGTAPAGFASWATPRLGEGGAVVDTGLQDPVIHPPRVGPRIGATITVRSEERRVGKEWEARRQHGK